VELRGTFILEVSMAAYKRLKTDSEEDARLAKASRRAAQVVERRAAACRRGIAGAEKQRDLMGDKWADATIEHYRAILTALGEQP
jgi:hypothetical protein